jgi:hypothetical protein
MHKGGVWTWTVVAFKGRREGYIKLVAYDERAERLVEACKDVPVDLKIVGKLNPVKVVTSEGARYVVEVEIEDVFSADTLLKDNGPTFKDESENAPAVGETVDI